MSKPFLFHELGEQPLGEVDVDVEFDRREEFVVETA